MAVPDMTDKQLSNADREDLADRIGDLQAERADQSDRLKAAIAWATNQYRQCIVSARASVDGGHYEKCNGRAEAYRQLTDEVAKAAGVDTPDWEAIKKAVPADGVYR